MMNFGAMNDSYYQPADDRMWDVFVDYCESEGLDPDVEDYDEWLEARIEEQEDEIADRAYDRYREGD